MENHTEPQSSVAHLDRPLATRKLRGKKIGAGIDGPHHRASN